MCQCLEYSRYLHCCSTNLSSHSFYAVLKPHTFVKPSSSVMSQSQQLHRARAAYTGGNTFELVL